MKKLALLMSLCFCLTIAHSQEQASFPENLTPANTILQVKTSQIKKLVSSVNYILTNFLTKEERESSMKDINEFKLKTGIDPLNPASLTSVGIDINRVMSLAVLSRGKHAQERVAVYLPVLNTKIFMRRFSEIVKNFNKDKMESSVFPVITDYKGVTIYQNDKDVFCAGIRGYYIVCSTQELIQEIIDNRDNLSKQLVTDPMYMDYAKNALRNNDFNLYASRAFLKEMMSGAGTRQQPRPQPVDGPQAMPAPVLQPVGYIAQNDGSMPDKKTAKQKDYFDEIDYVTAGLDFLPEKISLNIGACFNRNDTKAVSSMDIIATGMEGRALYLKEAASYFYLALNFKVIEQMCLERGTACDIYDKFKQSIKEESGIDFSRDVVPYYTGVVNVVGGVRKTQVEGQAPVPKGTFAALFPMSDGKRSIALLKKAGDAVKKKDKDNKGPDKNTGSEKIAGMNAVWFMDAGREKTYFLADKKGFYIGNDSGLIETLAKSKYLSEVSDRNSYTKKFTPSLFFLAFVKNAGEQTKDFSPQNSKDPYNEFLKKIGNVYLTGTKANRLLTVELEVQVVKPK